jgi:hypothetical protein
MLMLKKHTNGCGGKSIIWPKLQNLSEKKYVEKLYGAVFGIPLGLVGMLDFSENELDSHAAYFSKFNFIVMNSLLFFISSHIFKHAYLTLIISLHSSFIHSFLYSLIYS